MPPNSVIKPRIWPGVFLLGLSGICFALDYSGKVVNPDGSGCGGVTVSVSGSAISAVTASDGSWALSGTAGVQPRPWSVGQPKGNLRVQDGWLRLELSSRDLSGRILSSGFREANRSRVPATRSQGGAPDTLLYRLGDREFLRDTISESRSGMVRVYDTTWNANIVYGYLTDARDLQTYRTVQIGTQAWMAQNLNFKGVGVDSGWVQDNQPDSALKYGRLYMWTSVVASDTCKLWKQCTIKVVQPHRGICPAGWHVPSDGEWKSLEVAIGMSATVAESLQYRGMTEGTKLKSAAGWSGFSGWDVYGFRVLPGGLYIGGSTTNAGNMANFWLASDYDTYYAWIRRLVLGNPMVNRSFAAKSNGYSLRCLQD
jgi:uncharacterized protein (TIGR02145 family)